MVRTLQRDGGREWARGTGRSQLVAISAWQMNLFVRQLVLGADASLGLAMASVDLKGPPFKEDAERV